MSAIRCASRPFHGGLLDFRFIESSLQKVLVFKLLHNGTIASLRVKALITIGLFGSARTYRDNMLFRKDIGFLRAIAVAAVVLYHFNVPGFAGGFIGVDVFFVISGFLMTGLVIEKLQAGCFSLLEFYAARARRIIPPLLVLCISLLVFGFFFLPLDDYRECIRTLKSALFFTSNLTFSHTAGYFAAPLRENWLLHTWSLSVEWQFYLLYPLLLMGLHKALGKTLLLWGLLFLVAASLTASVLLTRQDPIFAFYLLPTRAWEMLVGGVVFLLPSKLAYRPRRALQLIGFLAIGISIECFSASDLWPGYLATLPVIGTILVIYASCDASIGGSKPIQYLGRISYSTYLWHWPLVVLLYTCGLLDNWMYVAGGIAAALFLGAVSYHLVESRVKPSASAGLTLCHYGLSLATFIGMASILASIVKDYPQARFAFIAPTPPQFDSSLYQRECYENPFHAKMCKLGHGKVSVILMGDSHAEAVGAAVQLGNPQASLSWSKGGCPILSQFQMRDKNYESDCKGFNRDNFENLKEHYPGVPVILLSRAALYTDNDRSNGHYVIAAGGIDQQASQGESYIIEYATTVCALAQHNPVYLVKPIPEMPFNVYKSLALQQAIFGRKYDISVALSDYYTRNRIALAAIERASLQCHVQVVDPVPLLCPAGRCTGSRKGEPIYADDNHLVDAGNQVIAPLFTFLFKQGASQVP